MEHLFDLTREVLQGKKENVATIDKNAVYCYPMVEYFKYDRFFDLGEYMKYMTEGREGLYKEYRDFLDNQVVIYKNVTNPFYYTEIPEEKFSGIPLISLLVLMNGVMKLALIGDFHGRVSMIW